MTVILHEELHLFLHTSRAQLIATHWNKKYFQQTLCRLIQKLKGCQI